MKQILKDNRNSFRRENKTESIAEATAYDQSGVVRLVEKAASGNFEAFGKLYHIYVERIYRYVFYQVKDKMLAEDITADVFVKALKAINSCRGKESTFSAWLYRIAHNSIIDNFRRAKRTMTIEIETARNLSSPKQEAEINLDRQELLEVIADLPPNQRQVIILKFIEGMDNGEIGRIMGKSQVAIRILQMRALAALRERLGGKQ